MDGFSPIAVGYHNPLHHTHAQQQQQQLMTRIYKYITFPSFFFKETWAESAAAAEEEEEDVTPPWGRTTTAAAAAASTFRQTDDVPWWARTFVHLSLLHNTRRLLFKSRQQQWADIFTGFGFFYFVLMTLRRPRALLLLLLLLLHLTAPHCTSSLIIRATFGCNGTTKTCFFFFFFFYGRLCFSSDHRHRFLIIKETTKFFINEIYYLSLSLSQSPSLCLFV